MKDRLGQYAETLGAYLEGRLPKGQMSLVEKVLASDNHLREILKEVKSTKVNLEEDIRADFPDFDERFKLPNIPDNTTDQGSRLDLPGIALAET